MNHKTIERFDVKAHIQGQSVNWEMWQLIPESHELIDRPLFAPISETEIAFLSFDDNGGVAIYNVET